MVSLKLCQKHPNIIPKHRWKFQLQTFADLIVRAILVLRCFRPPATKTWDSFNTCLGTSRIGTREPGGGGKLPPLTWKRWKLRPPPPPLWTVNFVHLYFGLFFVRDFVSPPKIVDEIRGVFILGKGYLGPPETFAPPQLQSSSCVPGLGLFLRPAAETYLTR